MALTVLFDMDGVLTDSEPVINAAAIMGLKEFGVDAKPDDFLPFVGAGEDRYIGGVAEKYGIKYTIDMKRTVYEIYLEIVDSRIKIYSGVKKLLKLLKDNNITCALASSSDMVKIKANIDACGITSDMFSAIVSGNDVVNKKPSPDIYLFAARKVGSATNECIVVEDAVNGIVAAKSAGMLAVGITNSFPCETLIAAGADVVINNIMELSEVIQKINMHV